ncbi:hypothetical protein D3C73_1123020 [compost metagenome]
MNMFTVDRRFIPRDTPATSEIEAITVTTAMSPSLNDRLTGTPNTWFRPVLICSTPMPSDCETPNAVTAAPMMSTVWPIGP